MDDLEFIQRCISKDKATWDEFLDKYSRLIYNYIRSVFNSKGYSCTEDHINDIFQDIFHSLIKEDFKKLRTFQGKNGCSLASWLRQVTIHATIDYLRKIKPTVSLDEELGEDFSLKDLLTDNTPVAAVALDDKERLQVLHDCIERLTTDDKYFLELHVNQGLRLEELKDILAVSRPAVDMQKLRIIERLRDCFKAKGFIKF